VHSLSVCHERMVVSQPFGAIQKMRVCWSLEIALKEAVSNHPLLLG
jgi:hypothetical protein